jgi:HAD superfamily phosphatase (TIGR01668 family)
MIEKFIDYKKCIPDEYVSDVFHIDYSRLYALGKRVIFFDLDNTLISYKETVPGQNIKNLIDSLQSIGFEVMVVSNSPKNRVRKASNYLNIKHVNLALKPLKFGFKRALRKCEKKYTCEQVLEVGDQLLTDVYGSRRMNFYTILVRAIDHKTEVRVTKLNRIRERKIINKIKNKDFESYITKLQKYESENL